MDLIEVKHAIKTYQTGEDSFNALNDVSLSVKKGEFVAIMGASGSGKSTFMNMLGTLDKPTSGSYFLDGEDIYSCSIETGEGAPVMVVMGNESEGISSGVADTVSKRLFIPPFPHNEPGSESLNVAVATAVTVAEFRRRLQHGL